LRYTHNRIYFFRLDFGGKQSFSEQTGEHASRGQEDGSNHNGYQGQDQIILNWLLGGHRGRGERWFCYVSYVAEPGGGSGRGGDGAGR